jgi:desulfoferrodoxin (superoxide reductase-like protein)
MLLVCQQQHVAVHVGMLVSHVMTLDHFVLALAAAEL